MILLLDHMRLACYFKFPRIRQISPQVVPFPPHQELQTLIRSHGMPIPSLNMYQSIQLTILQFNPVSTTHRTLGIAEILRLVFDQIRFVGGFETLKSACLVSQAFKDPALDAMWYHLNGLSPLLSILPLERNGNLLVSRHGFLH